jgi:hypothetical protein
MDPKIQLNHYLPLFCLAVLFFHRMLLFKLPLVGIEVPNGSGLTDLQDSLIGHLVEVSLSLGMVVFHIMTFSSTSFTIR